MIETLRLHIRTVLISTFQAGGIGFIVGALFSGIVFLPGIFESIGVMLFCIVPSGGIYGFLVGLACGLLVGVAEIAFTQLWGNGKQITPVKVWGVSLVAVGAFLLSYLILDVTFSPYMVIGSWSDSVLSMPIGILVSIATLIYFWKRMSRVSPS